MTEDQQPDIPVVQTGTTPGMTPEKLVELTDKAIDGQVVPKKIPALDDLEGQRGAVVGALAAALMFGLDYPVHMAPEVIGSIADQLLAQGVRQTEHIDSDALHAPAWVTDGVRQESVKLPEQMQHTEAEPFTAQTAEAPARPKRIAKAARAVRL